MTFTASEVVAIVCGAFGLSTAVILLLIRWGRASDRAKIKGMLEAFKVEIRNDVNASIAAAHGELEKFQLVLNQIATDREACGGRHTAQAKETNGQVEKIRDKWEVFIRDDAAMEATRGRKVEALFGVVDSMKENVRSLPAAMNSKLDEMFRSVREELRSEIKRYVREQLQDQKSRA
jgi:hypothetical protein